MPIWTGSARLPACRANGRSGAPRSGSSSAARLTRRAPPRPRASSPALRRRSRAGVAVDEAFVPALAPGWLDHFIYNEQYKTDEEFVYALANAMSDKYHAIVDAGFILQIDDPGIATSWDMMKPEPSVADYRKYVRLRIEALNHALDGHPAGARALSLVLGQLARRTCQRYTAAPHHRHRANGERPNLFVRGGQRTAPARDRRLEGGEACAGHDPDAGGDQPRHEHRRTSRAHRAAARRLGECRRARECRGRRRLRHGRPGASRDRLGEASRARRGDGI